MSGRYVRSSDAGRRIYLVFENDTGFPNYGRKRSMSRNSLWLICAVCLLFAHAGTLNVAVAGQEGATQKADYEILFWQTVKDSESIDMYRAYLRKFPDGLFADLARIKIKALENKPSKAPTALPVETTKSASQQPLLRNTPLRLETDDLKKMLRKHNFHDWYLNYDGDFNNQFTDNGDGTVADEATGLVWEKVGSWRRMNLTKAHAYIDHLNRKKFAGRSDWRLPTVEEAASLIERNSSSRDWLFIDTIFGEKDGNWLDACWTSDSLRPILGADHTAWIVSFKLCAIKAAHWYDGTSLGAFHPAFEYNYVRAVRNAK